MGRVALVMNPLAEVIMAVAGTEAPVDHGLEGRMRSVSSDEREEDAAIASALLNTASVIFRRSPWTSKRGVL